MTPATSSSDRARVRPCIALLTALLATGACRQAPPPSAPAAPPERASAVDKSPEPPLAPAHRLKTQAAHLTAVELLSCPEGRQLATLPAAPLRQLQGALAQATLSGDTALTPPPWDVRLVFRLDTGPSVFGQLVRSDVLRLYPTASCAEARAEGELRLGEDAEVLEDWLQARLGPTQEKAYQLPPGLPPPPGD